MILQAKLIAGLGTVLLILVGLFLCPTPSYARITSHEYDWLVGIQSKVIKNYFSHPNTRVTTVIRAAIAYQYVGKTETRRIVTYEDILYAAGTPLAGKRYHPFKVRSGDAIAIRVRYSSASPTEEEIRAVNNAAVRVMLDAFLNGNRVVSLMVPTSMFNRAGEELKREGFYPFQARAGMPIYSSLLLRLVSEPDGMTQSMQYLPDGSH